MSETVQYRVRRRMKYNGRWYAPGELWQPAGSKYDGQIIRTGLVATERVGVAAPPAAAPASGPGDPDAGQPQMVPPAVEAARSDRRREKAANGPEPRPMAGGPA